MNTQDIALFHRIVESGSLIAASNSLEIPKSTISRRLGTLESEIGTKLFHRSGRTIQLTMSGEHFYQQTKQILAELDQTLIDITDDKAELKGNLKLLVAPGPKHEVVFDRVFEFMDLHPQVNIELITKVEPVDLLKEHIDVALVGWHMFTNVDVVAKPMIKEPMRYYCTPEYQHCNGVPEQFEQLAEHNVALLKYTSTDQSHRALLPDGSWQVVHNQFATNDPNALRQAVFSSRFIALLPERVHQQDVEKGRLVALFSSEPNIDMDVFIVYPAQRYISIVAQKFVSYLSEVAGVQP